jgi:hypothetical protein
VERVCESVVSGKPVGVLGNHGACVIARSCELKSAAALLLLHNFHRFLNNPEVVQTAFTQLVAGKQQRTFLIVLAPIVQTPVELEKLFVVLEHGRTIC